MSDALKSAFEDLVKQVEKLTAQRDDLLADNRRNQELFAKLTAERDAAFKMSKCECGPEECCANLVKAWAERDVARNAALEEAARLCDSWGDAVDRHKWPTPFRMAEIIREMKGGSDE